MSTTEVVNSFAVQCDKTTVNSCIKAVAFIWRRLICKVLSLQNRKSSPEHVKWKWNLTLRLFHNYFKCKQTFGMQKAAGFSPTSTTLSRFFELWLLFESGWCATWVRRILCGLYLSATYNQVRLLYTTLRYLELKKNRTTVTDYSKPRTELNPQCGKADVQHQDCTQSFFAQLQDSRLVSIIRRSSLRPTTDTSREVAQRNSVCNISWWRTEPLGKFSNCSVLFMVQLPQGNQNK